MSSIICRVHYPSTYTGFWREKIANAIGYTSTSQLSRRNDSDSLQVLTIHGIRTYGSWQNEIKIQVEALVGNISFNTYKYGYFSAISLFIPFLRNKEIEELSKNLLSLFAKYPHKKFIIYSHSFGTYLITYALKKIIDSGGNVPIEILVLSGSVLKANFNWSFIEKNNIEIKVVNDCACNDYILLLSEIFIPGLGMAGKIGFKGFNNRLILNRFYRGGHSSYFENKKFMQTYWIPLLAIEDLSTLSHIDERNGDFINNELIDQIAKTLGGLKNYIYLSLFLYLIYKLLLNLIT